MPKRKSGSAGRKKVFPAKVATSPRYGYFSTDPTLSGYENLIGTCRECDAKLIVNRATDLRNTYPSAGVTFRCPRCKTMLRPGGDIASHPVDQFVYDAYEPLLRRRYMQTVVLLAQSLELALVMCAKFAILGAVKRPARVRRDSPFAVATAKFESVVDGLTLEPLRRVVASLATSGRRPTSVNEAAEVIQSFKKMRAKIPSDADVADIADETLRSATRDLLAAAAFVELRNAVVHEARRPTQSQAERFFDEIPKLTRGLMRGFGIMKGQLVMPPTAAAAR